MLLLRIDPHAAKPGTSHNIIPKPIVGILHFFLIRYHHIVQQDVAHCPDGRHLPQFYRASVIFRFEAVIQENPHRPGHILHDKPADYDIRNISSFRTLYFHTFPPYIMECAVGHHHIADAADGFQPNAYPCAKGRKRAVDDMNVFHRICL